MRVNWLYKSLKDPWFYPNKTKYRTTKYILYRLYRKYHYVDIVFVAVYLSTMVGESEPDYDLFTLGTPFTNID